MKAVFGSTAGLRGDQTPLGRRDGADVGDPQTGYAELYEKDGIEAGVWSSSEGGWPIVDRSDTEVVVILSGRARITDADGDATEVVAGDVFVLPKGWSGRWDVIEPIEKIYVTVEEN